MCFKDFKCPGCLSLVDAELSAHLPCTQVPCNLHVGVDQMGLCGFKPCLSQINDLKIDTCYFLARLSALFG